MDTKFLRQIIMGQKIAAALFGLFVILLGGLSYYGYTQIETLSERITSLDARFASTTASLSGNIASTTDSFDIALKKERQSVFSQIVGVRDQVGSITGTVTDLQKLSKTDPELLSKYSKVFFLSDNYAPARLKEIPVDFLYDDKQTHQIIPEVLPHLQNMLNQAKSDGVDLYVKSAYRSFSAQSAIKTSFTVSYGAGTANTFSADQGYSEHQLGTTVDLITTGTKGLLDGFDKTQAYKWTTSNAHKYGFVLSYPKDNGYYIFEPWHWRFVGVKLATKIHNSNTYFYKMDQRDIDAYLISLFD